GIGVTRLLGAAIEQNHDARGIIWPRAIAPFEVVVVPLGYGKSAAVREVADDLYRQLSAAGVEVILDDRDERPGVMFADWELIGIPLRITVGERSLKEGNVELVRRRDLQTEMVPVAEAITVLRERLAAL
ncbi:MAG: His/Gly/Thr/Pro-type tRNA ligase C-terminal domain-containing protein, partial [Burkholderiales bacterium]|nr:His/Gly/Thr/Pro-type tRNA ligase C-terminal domain-containing protein [Burkholderiales bacterium]